MRCGVSNSNPATEKAGMPTSPDGPPVTSSNPITQLSTSNPNASVASARYNPRSRSVTSDGHGEEARHREQPPGVEL